MQTERGLRTIDGEELQRLRKSQGKSLRQLGLESGISYIAISHIEQGIRTPRHRTLKAIVDALGVEIQALTTETPSPELVGAARKVLEHCDEWLLPPMSPLTQALYELKKAVEHIGEGQS